MEINIWIVNHYAIPYSQPGITRNYSFAKELVSKGYEVTIIASNYNYQTKKYIHNNMENYFFEDINGVNFLWINTPAYTTNSWARLWNMFVFYERVRKINNKTTLLCPDIIIGSSPQPLAALAAERLASYYKIPFIMEVRDLWPQSLIDIGGTSKYHPFIVYLSWLERYLYRKADQIVTALPGVIGYINKLGLPKEKITWISNGIDLSLIPEPAKSNNIGNETFTIMYTGAHGVGNSLDTILYTAELLIRQGWSNEKILFRLIGDGVEKENLKEKAGKLKLNNVVFEDAVSKEMIFYKMQEADAFICVMKKSDLYKWGISINKLYDYLAMACPTIFAVNAYNNPIEESGCGISIPPEDPQALADAIIKLYNMPAAEREAMGLKGRKHVEENYDFVKLADKLEEVLLESIESYKVRN